MDAKCNRPARRRWLVAAGAAAAAAMPGFALGAAGAIEAVLLQQGYGTGVGTSLTVAYRARVLFDDGSYTTDAARALSARPRIDGSWQRSAGGWTLTARDGKRSEIAAKMRARPVPAGSTLEGDYRSLSGAGGAPMNVVAVSAWKNLRFARDGSVQQVQAAGARGGGVATSSAMQAPPARYRLDGYTIELVHADGRRERQLFYLFPDSDNVIGLGAATLSRRR